MAVETISAPLSEEVITSETPKIPNITSSSVLLVKPPPDIRAVVDRTALFVSKNGRVSSLIFFIVVVFDDMSILFNPALPFSVFPQSFFFVTR